MQFERQAFNPSATATKIIADCAQRLAPEDEAMATWHRLYVLNHQDRIALDLDIARQSVSQNTKILEFGSVPLLFTAALAQCEYQETGVDRLSVSS